MLVSQNSTRRNYKDSVFVDLFAHDISAKENFCYFICALSLFPNFLIILFSSREI